jgi:uncharacterized repeat protein (TIGR04076 family)
MVETKPKHGDKVIGTIKSVKGHCNAGHKVGDKFEISCRNAAGLCGWLYSLTSPYSRLAETPGEMVYRWKRAS